jgi:putative pyruvate formate lyase activating enzyme
VPEKPFDNKAMKHAASYTLLTDADWDERIAAAEAMSSPCMLCPRKCGVDRRGGEKGFCGASGKTLDISSIFPHHGEEPPISGKHGSGTVFFSHCSLRCCFCQNYQISQENEGEPYTESRCADRMVDLQTKKVHNINLVTATHYLPWVLKSLRLATKKGLCIPIVWNSSGYESVEPLALLKDIVDIFLPDMKYGSNDSAKRYCNAQDYVEVNQAAVREMFRSVGPLKCDTDGIAYRGLCFRHLVLPQGRSYTHEILSFIIRTFDPSDITMSLMAQYRPMYKASGFEELCRGITHDEYEEARRECEKAGVNAFFQEQDKLDDRFCIDFAARKEEELK